ncbi:MAG: amidohydrolase family protein [Pseudomonadota bacterium]
MRILGLAAAAAVIWGSAAAEDIHVIHAGTLMAVPGEAPLTDQTIVVRGREITAITAGFSDADSIEQAAGDTVTVHDLRDGYVMPGFIDGHVHLTFEFNDNLRLQSVEMSNPDRALFGAENARKTLMAGFTTVRDVGAGGGDAIYALRDAIEKGWVPGPRIYASGQTISITGGHGDGTQGYRDDVAHLMTSSAICNGADDCRRAVREQIRRGADHIKITATGGVLSNTATGTEQQFFDDELQAIMDSAHSLGRKVTAHAHGKQGIDAAIRAGVDSIEHGTYLDRESIRLFRSNGVFLVPTALAGKTVADWAADPDRVMTSPQRAKAAVVGPLMKDMVRRAYEGGVSIAFGTDSGVSAHGINAQEFALYVEAGMSPMEAIRSATVMGAENLGKSAMIGTIEPGKRADIVAVMADPLADITALEAIDFVMKDGTVYKSQ